MSRKIKAFKGFKGSPRGHEPCLSLLHSERPKLYAIFAFLSAIGLIML